MRPARQAPFTRGAGARPGAGGVLPPPPHVTKEEKRSRRRTKRAPLRRRTTTKEGGKKRCDKQGRAGRGICLRPRGCRDRLLVCVRMRPTRGNLAPPPSPRHATKGHKGTKPARRDTYRVSTCRPPGAPRPQQCPPRPRCWSPAPCSKNKRLSLARPGPTEDDDRLRALACLPGAAVQRKACDGRAFDQTLRRHPQGKTCTHHAADQSVASSQHAPQRDTSAADGAHDARPPLAPTASRERRRSNHRRRRREQSEGEATIARSPPRSPPVKRAASCQMPRSSIYLASVPTPNTYTPPKKTFKSPLGTPPYGLRRS